MRLRHELGAVPVYYLLSGGYAFFTTLVFSVDLIFQTSEAGLNPLQLILVGTALEATGLVCEVPTGVLADLYSRRLSVLIGLVLLGAGLMLGGALPRFETILLAQPIWGLGYTFVSGAKEAWLADEAGAAHAGPVYLRASQIGAAARILAIPPAIAIATFDLNLPILLGGALLIVLAAVLALIMPERNFQRPARGSERRWADFRGTFVAGAGLVRRSPLLMTVFAIAAFYGMASEGFDRLDVKHFYDNLGFPALWSLEPVVWLGAINMGAALLPLAAMELMRRRLDTSSHAQVSRWLLTINAGLAVGVLAFALAGGFYIGVAAFLVAMSFRRLHDPLFLAWLNQSIESRVRATVISMSAQTDAIGQIAGGPVIGVIGSVVSLRAAIASAGIVLLPALAMYMRAVGLRSEAREQDAR
jgi:DHA3 family tetracycline resistance protein-like MFS transporter